MTTTRYSDLYIEQDDEGIFDLVLDGSDFKTTDGLDSAIVVSLFSDRRAYDTEVRDPLKRRGWIGDTVAEVAGDRHGSGLWLYEQKRLTGETAVGLRNEARQSLEWLADDGYAADVEASVISIPSSRQVLLDIEIPLAAGGSISRGYILASATISRAILDLADS